MRRYKKYEFCEAVKCHECQTHRSLENEPQCGRSPENCLRTAKEFHKWLTQNLFVIEQPENEYEASNL